MSKRLIAAFLVTLFVLSAVLIAVPTQAHTLLGRQTGTTPYRIRDSEVNPNHVPGPIAYIWPGGGKDWWTGALETEPPGYQSPWGAYPAFPGASTWWQLRGNAYAPFGAILTSMEDHDNIGDLVFALKWWPFEPVMGEEWKFDLTSYTYDTVYLYVPSEFGLSAESYGTNIAATIESSGYGTMDSSGMSVADVKDPFGPGYTIVKIPGRFTFTEANDWTETYYIRLNNVRAPDIAGRYIFKLFYNDTFPLSNVALEDGTIPNVEGEFNGIMTSTIPVENWPVLLVKGEIDPGIAEGTIFFSSWDTNLIDVPLALPGRVRFVGEAYDPYTWQPTGRMVEARGYFNASANGHWEVEGIAPGVYDVYASAAGYPEALQATGVEIHPGKSIHMNLALNPGVIIHGTVYAKHAYGDVYWWGELPVMIEIYDSNEWPAAAPGYAWGDVGGAQPDNYMEWETAHLKSFSPVNLTDAPYTSYVNGPQPLWVNIGGVPVLDWMNDHGQGAVTARAVAFPWEKTLAGPYGLANKDPDGVHNGVGPAQTWFTDPKEKQFDFQFGNKFYNTLATPTPIQYGLYGAPTEFDGHIPQAFASWINGLTPGTYYLRAWINGYVQTDASGSYVDYSIQIADQEWAGDISVPMDVQLNGFINKTVHFQEAPGTLKQWPVLGPDAWRFLIAEARDAQGTLVAFNFTQVLATESSAVIQLRGFGMAGPIREDTIDGIKFDTWDSQWPDTWHRDEQPNDFTYSPLLGTAFKRPVGMHFSLYNYRHIRDYGIMPGTYKVYVYMRGYVQQEFEMASIALSGAPTQISNHMYRGAGINFTIYSIDWEHPRIDRNWINPEPWNPPVTIQVYRGACDAEDAVYMGDVFFFRAHDYLGNPGRDIGTWGKPEQNEAYNMLPNAGWDPAWSKLKFNGSVILERFGPDETIGVWTPHPNDEQGTLWWSTIRWGLGFLHSPWTYRDADLKTTVALETGTYSFKAMALGYVFKDACKYDLYAAKGSQADTKLNLMIGYHFDYAFIFKKEGLLTTVPYDLGVWLAFWDENGNYVAGAYPYVSSELPEGATVSGTTWGDQLNVDTFYGIDACPNYNGPWTVTAQTWWHPMGNPPQTTMWVSPFTPFTWNAKDWYPPPAVLMGYYADPRPGPWEMRTEIMIPNGCLFGSSSFVFEFDERPLLTGQLAGFSYSDELRSISWATISVSGAAGEFKSYSFDGIYEMYVPRGDYEMTITVYNGDQGFKSQTVSITAPDGGTAAYNFLNFERSNIPVPEFPVAAIAAFAALAASLFIIRKAKRN